MSGDRPRYYFIKRNRRAYWMPGKFGASYGFDTSIALGPDGAEAKAEAIRLNEKLDAARKARRDGEAAKVHYPAGSLGSFYEKFRLTEAWGLMEPATRDGYERAWPHIEKRFGRTLITRITADESERFHVDLHPQHANKRDPKGTMKLSWHTAHLVLKVWRLLLTALVSYNVRPAPAPIGRVSNPKPPSRTAVWVDPEVTDLVDAAGELELHGMALAIQIGWDTMMSPVDVRSLPIGEGTDPLEPGWTRGVDGAPGTIATRRKKSGVIVRLATNPELDEAIAAYLERLKAAGIDIGPTTMLVRRKDGKPYRDRHDFKEEFADTRARAFPGDTRRFADLRRSGATEAKLGGVDNKDLAPSMANSLDRDEGLQSTYIVAASTKVNEARKAGRSKHTAKFRNGKK